MICTSCHPWQWVLKSPLQNISFWSPVLAFLRKLSHIWGHSTFREQRKSWIDVEWKFKPILNLIQHAFHKLSTFLRFQQCWTTCSNAPNIWFNKALNASWSKCWNRLNGPLPMLKKATNISWLFFLNCWRFSHLTQNELKEP